MAGFWALLLLACFSDRAARAEWLETFVEAVGGQSGGVGFSCSTYASATPALGFFAQVTPGIPTDGLANCGIAGGFRTTTLTLGPLTDAMSLNTTFNAAGANSFAGTTATTAEYGRVGAEAHGTFVGPVNSGIVRGAASYAMFLDTLAPSSPSVTGSAAGFVRLRFTIEGALSVTGPLLPNQSVADVEMNYRINGGPSYVLMRAQATNPAAVPFVATGVGGGGVGVPGFTAIPGSVAGLGTVDTFYFPFTWGDPIDLQFGILASVIPSGGFDADVDFASTATLTGIELFANGQPVTDFSIVSDSGTFYDADGAHPVPEPSLAAMLLVGSGALAGVSARHRPRNRPRDRRSVVMAARFASLPDRNDATLA